MKRFLIVFTCFLMSCSSSNVIADFDDNTVFESYKTFGFYQNVGNGLNELDVKRILRIIDTTLQQKGLRFSEKPDFFIDFSSKQSDNLPRNTVAVGFGNAGRNSVFGVSGGIPIGNKKVLETITIEFLTPEKEQLFWKALLESKVKEKRTPIEKELYFNEVIPKILSNYPPK